MAKLPLSMRHFIVVKTWLTTDLHQLGACRFNRSRGVVEAAIQRASSATGVDFGYLMGAATRESGYNPNAKAKTSSATGLFQFLDQTWLATLKQHGATGCMATPATADLIQRGPSGHYYVNGRRGARDEVSWIFGSTRTPRR